jgi:hypothetical protein
MSDLTSILDGVKSANHHPGGSDDHPHHHSLPPRPVRSHLDRARVPPRAHGLGRAQQPDPGRLAHTSRADRQRDPARDVVAAIITGDLAGLSAAEIEAVNQIRPRTLLGDGLERAVRWLDSHADAVFLIPGTTPGRRLSTLSATAVPRGCGCAATRPRCATLE